MAAILIFSTSNPISWVLNVSGEVPMKMFLSLLPLIALGACAVGPSLQTRMASYTGASAQTLVQTFGVPDKQITVDDTQYFAYDRHHLEFDPGFSRDLAFGPYGGFSPFYGGYYGGPIISAGAAPALSEQDCETTFMLRQGKVVSFSFRGNDCT